MTHFDSIMVFDPLNLWSPCLSRANLRSIYNKAENDPVKQSTVLSAMCINSKDQVNFTKNSRWAGPPKSQTTEGKDSCEVTSDLNCGLQCLKGGLR